MKVKQSNPTVIEIQTNTWDEKQVRQRFERLGYDEEVYLVLHIERQSDQGEKDVVGKQEDEDQIIKRVRENIFIPGHKKFTKKHSLLSVHRNLEQELKKSIANFSTFFTFSLFFTIFHHFSTIFRIFFIIFSQFFDSIASCKKSIANLVKKVSAKKVL